MKKLEDYKFANHMTWTMEEYKAYEKAIIIADDTQGKSVKGKIDSAKK